MTTTAPTFAQIKAQVAAIRKKVPNARVIGIRAPGRWAGERLRTEGEETYLIEQCDSPLAVRIALRAEQGPKTTKVVITSLEDKDLSDDILVRIAKRQLFPIDPWQIVKSLFQAHAIDPRLTRHRWIADSLLEFIPDGGYPPATGGFLDAETAWPMLLDRTLGLKAERPDLLSILRWSIDPESWARLREASVEFRDAAAAWLTELAGAASLPILQSIGRGARPDAVPIGLACAVVFHPKVAGKLDRAVGKMEERFFGGQLPERHVIERWSAAATEVVRTQIADPSLRRSLLQRADEILREVGAESHAHLSATSLLGFDQRLEAFGKCLAGLIDSRQFASLERLLAMREEIGEHELATRERRRLECADMAIRLVRWLSTLAAEPLNKPRSLAEAVEYHLREGGYADWARLTLRLGEPVRALSEAYSQLFDRVTEVREAQSRHFAELLRLATEAGTDEATVIPVEMVLERVVAPLVAERPVLLLVVDGMSVAICRELLADTVGHDWIPISPDGRDSVLRAGLATIPSVTEVSRTSLFCGALRRGAYADERLGFSEHPALRAVPRGGHPPVLFHKASLRDEDDAVLSAEVRAEIASTLRRVVGVVVNAVDDHLLKGEQLDMRWTRDAIPVLSALLHEARLSGRLVILMSDHGHVLDAKTTCVVQEGGERWRVAASPPTDGEIQLSGPRVVIPEAKTLVAPWSERIRYGIKKNGYHGGVTPQEMVIPIAILSSSEPFPEGWTEATFDLPGWWEGELPTKPTAAVRPTRPPTAKPKPKQANMLFNLDEEQAKRGAEPLWVGELVASPIFELQKGLAGRSALSIEVFRLLLTALDQRGGKMTSTALSRAMNYPSIRLRGFLAIAQRVLNIDGYAVLTRDETSDTVELNRELLRRQFDLG
jgi:hypothetical protein